MVSKEKKAEYNKRYREKLRESIKDEPKEDLKEHKEVVRETKKDFFFTLKNKILETAIMASIPIIIKVGHSLILSQLNSKPQSQEPLPPVEQKQSNIFDNLNNLHNF